MKNLDYGIIGNCRTAALISKDGSIDWCCLPNFNSQSVFARILDTERGGFFGIAAEGNYSIEQHYINRTNILLTSFRKNKDVFEIIDFMPRYKTELGYYHTPPDIIRYIRHVSGKPRVRFFYQPKLVYAQHDTQSVIEDDYIKSFTVAGKYESIYLYSDINPTSILNAEEVIIDQHHFFLLSYNQKLIKLNCNRIDLEYERTKVYWLNWMESTKRFTKYNDEIGRSALVLKLLSYHKTGAILASVTTSLPEIPGENRNWDYRFCWIRDASMTISILTVLGHYNSARRFLNFITDVIPYKDEKMQVVYGIHREKRLIERELPWLSRKRRISSKTE
jgi:GH15 family glucan-1,4-alpha-glucosidase